MIDWLAFLSVLVASIIGACGVVFLFSVGLRLVGSDVRWRRPVGVLAFVLCGLVILFGLYLIIPAFHR